MDPLWARLLEPPILGLMIPIVAIVGGCTTAIAKMVIEHRERMVKLEQGIDPDATREAA